MAPKLVSLSRMLGKKVSFQKVFGYIASPELINPGFHSAPFQATELLSPRLKELRGIVDVLPESADLLAMRH